jgi:hypothetical protein
VAGIVLDAEGCERADELAGLSVLISTIIKVGEGNVQVVVAGEGSLELSHSTNSAIFKVSPTARLAPLKMHYSTFSGMTVPFRATPDQNEPIKACNSLHFSAGNQS